MKTKLQCSGVPVPASVVTTFGLRLVEFIRFCIGTRFPFNYSAHQDQVGPMRVIVLVCAMLFGAMTQIMAQSPSSIAGYGFEMVIADAWVPFPLADPYPFPFANTGSFILAPTDNSNYKVVGFDGLLDSSGTYTYPVYPGGTNSATITLLDSAAGNIVCKLTFINATSGMFEIHTHPIA